jgi:hypothetical protein
MEARLNPKPHMQKTNRVIFILFNTLAVLIGLTGVAIKASAMGHDMLPPVICVGDDCSSAHQMLFHNLESNSEATTPTEESTTVYVASSTEKCLDFSPCYTNTLEDGIDGLGTGLREAVVAVSDGDEIVILDEYTIKSNTVLIDKELTLRGHEDSTLTYIGSDCNLPMLSITAGTIIKDLTIDDEYCRDPSRTLIEINSKADVTLEHNSLINGKHAVKIFDNDGDVTIAFNHIANHEDQAIYHQDNNTGTGIINIYANNLLNNGTNIQVDCSNRGTANHNFWGNGITPSASTVNCTVDDAKRLGAPILLSPDTAGVEAIRQTVTETTSYAFNNNIGVSRLDGEDYTLIIVNHGQGGDSNIPFYQSGSEKIEACSNFYDVFLAEGTTATSLVLSLRYDLNSDCVNTIETDEYCTGSDSTKYPLWWYDPANNITDGWDRTGQNPEGQGADGEVGQTTVCNIENKEIRVTIDNTGRPGIEKDLGFTPFVVGLLLAADTPSPTPTVTPTLASTPFPTLTATLYYFPSATAINLPSTSTPSEAPTPVRTFSPESPKPTDDPNTGYPIEEATQTPISGYPPPVDNPTSTPPPGYPPPESEDDLSLTPTISPTVESDLAPPDHIDSSIPAEDGEEILETKPARWLFLVIGAAISVGLLSATSVLLAKSRLL